MTTREIAELTGKQHNNVKRDVREMLERLELDALRFERIYMDSRKRKQTEYSLTKDLTLTLISGYDTKLRHTIVTRWQELELEVNGETLANASTLDVVAEALNRLQLESQEKSINTYTVTELGARMGLKATEVNFMLRTSGLQTVHRVDGKIAYKLTSKGLEYGIEYTSGNCKASQLRWRLDVLSILKPTTQSQ